METHGSETRVYQLQGVLFFGTIYKLAKLIADDIANAESPIRRVIIDFEHIQDLDTSAIQGMAKVVADCRRRDVDLWPCGLDRLSGRRQSEILSQLVEGSPTAYLSLEETLERAEDLTLERHGAPGQGAAPSSELLFTDQKYLGEVTEFFERRVIPNGHPLITQGDKANDMYFLRRGVLSVEIDFGHGKRVRVGVYFAGSVIGEMALYTGGERSAHVIATSECEVLRLTVENLEKMEREVPEMAIQLHRIVAGQISARLRRSNDLVRLLKA